MPAVKARIVGGGEKGKKRPSLGQSGKLSVKPSLQAPLSIIL